MFEAFEEYFGRSAKPPLAPRLSEAARLTPLDAFRARYGGRSYGRSLLRVVGAEEVAEWDERIVLAFPDLAPSVTCVAFDWRGQAIVLDSNDLINGEPTALLLDVDAGDHYTLETDLLGLANQALIEQIEPILGVQAYEAWLGHGDPDPARDECIGLIKPLFLGGASSLANMELVSLDVHWHIVGQILEQVRNLPEGTRIRDVTIEGPTASHTPLAHEGPE
jgi:hypothetical protein